MTASTVRIKLLQAPTRDSWLPEVLANLETVLLDHSHCERKAASTALNFMFRYPSNESLIHQLTQIAQEELTHFAQVNQWLTRLGISLAPLNAPPYAAQLKSQIRRQEPWRFLDSLLISALIEARSHERLGLLGHACPNPELAKFYRSLMASEARHYGIYWLLAIDAFDRELVDQRLTELASIEAQILETPFSEPRIHS
ncbi:MAG: tRNA-(ms[2]io[6]A)-hydroxylase [Cyanobacteria bacterium P01_H01_bin.15]